MWFQSFKVSMRPFWIFPEDNLQYSNLPFDRLHGNFRNLGNTSQKPWNFHSAKVLDNDIVLGNAHPKWLWWIVFCIFHSSRHLNKYDSSKPQFLVYWSKLILKICFYTHNLTWKTLRLKWSQLIPEDCNPSMSQCWYNY